MPAASRSKTSGKQTGGAGGVRGRRDFEALRARRMQAADMFRRGKRQVDVVTKLGVSAQTASRWYRAWQQGGRAGLVGGGRAGRARRLTDGQLAEVEAALAKARGRTASRPRCGRWPGWPT